MVESRLIERGWCSTGERWCGGPLNTIDTTLNTNRSLYENYSKYGVWTNTYDKYRCIQACVYVYVIVEIELDRSSHTCCRTCPIFHLSSTHEGIFTTTPTMVKTPPIRNICGSLLNGRRYVMEGTEILFRGETLKSISCLRHGPWRSLSESGMSQNERPHPSNTWEQSLSYVFVWV